MKRTLTMTIETDEEENTFDLDVYDSTTGYLQPYVCIPYEPEKHETFDKLMGREIYFWLSVMKEENKL